MSAGFRSILPYGAMALSYAATITLSPAPDRSYSRTFAPVISLVQAYASGTELYIGGVSYGNWIKDTFRLEKTMVATTGSCQLHYQSSPKPEAGQEAAMFWEGTKRFGGLVKDAPETAVEGREAAGVGTDSFITVNFAGFESLFDEAVVAKLYYTAIGAIASIIVHNLWLNHLSPFGITYVFEGDPGVSMGEPLYHYLTLREVFQKIKDLCPGWDIWIDDNKRLHFKETSGAAVTAPFAINRSSQNCDAITVTRSGGRKPNRVWVLPSSDLVALRVDERDGDGATQFFLTDYAITQKPIIRINLGGGGFIEVDPQYVTEVGVWPAGWRWYYLPGDRGVIQNPADAPLDPGDTVAFAYPNPFPLAFKVEDLASIAANGLSETVEHGKNVTTQAEAELIAAGKMAAGDPEVIDAEYNSGKQSEWLNPGMVIDVDYTMPDVVGEFIIDSVTSQEEGLGLWRHTWKGRNGPGDSTGIADAQFLATSLRVPIDNPPVRATFELFDDIPGITNPGAEVGPIKKTWEVQAKGVIASWDAQAKFDPPTGSRLVFDVKLNEVSILPTESPLTNASKIIIPDGETGLVTGFRFVSDNIPVVPGDLIEMECLEIGSTLPGANILAHINIKSQPVQ